MRSLYEGTTTAIQPVLGSLWKGFDDEIRRYGLAINDPSEPVHYLRVVTSTEQAQIHLTERILMLQKMNGTDFPFEVVHSP
jgi:hypothetical protein